MCDGVNGPNRMKKSVVVKSKGLQNNIGDNNCFLNSAVQVLWHLDVFRQNFRELSGHACVGGGECIFCSLKVIFTQFEFSDEKSLPPLALRVALAKAFKDKQRFQLFDMDDAAECFENILMRLHHHVAHGESEDDCKLAHCLTHQKFAMNLDHYHICECGAWKRASSFVQLVHYITTHSIIEQSSSTNQQQLSFGHRLKNAFSNGEISKPCPNNCGRMAQSFRVLMSEPDVISIGLIWNSDAPSARHISDFVSCIDTTLVLSNLFDIVKRDTCLELVGVVCYYGKHYSTFFLHSKRNIWISFDDEQVNEIGPDWAQIVAKIERGRYQPLLLLYQNASASCIQTTSAPKDTTMVTYLVNPSSSHATPSASSGTVNASSSAGGQNSNNSNSVSVPRPASHTRSPASRQLSRPSALPLPSGQNHNDLQNYLMSSCLANNNVGSPVVRPRPGVFKMPANSTHLTVGNHSPASPGVDLLGPLPASLGQPTDRPLIQFTPPVPASAYGTPQAGWPPSTVMSQTPAMAGYNFANVNMPMYSQPPRNNMPMYGAARPLMPQTMHQISPLPYGGMYRAPSPYATPVSGLPQGSSPYNPSGFLPYPPSGSCPFPVASGQRAPASVNHGPSTNLSAVPLLPYSQLSGMAPARTAFMPPAMGIPTVGYQFRHNVPPEMSALSSTASSLTGSSLSSRNVSPHVIFHDELSKDDLSLLEDALKEEDKRFGCTENENLPVSSCPEPGGVHLSDSVNLHLEKSLEISDGSLSDWSVVDSPAESSTRCMASSLLKFSSESDSSISSISSDSRESEKNSVAAHRPEIFTIIDGAEVASTGGDSSVPSGGNSTNGEIAEQLRKADDLMALCDIKERASDLHSCLLCSNQALLLYKQVVDRMPPAEAAPVLSKQDIARDRSRHFYSAIQASYSNARAGSAKHPASSAGTPEFEPSNGLSHADSEDTTDLDRDISLIQLDENVPSVRHLMLKEQVGQLYGQPTRKGAVRVTKLSPGPRSPPGVVSFVQHQQHGFAQQPSFPQFGGVQKASAEPQHLPSGMVPSKPFQPSAPR